MRFSTCSKMAKVVKLNTGHLMPLVGVGTFKIWGADILSVLDCALNAGYRAIDSATVYRNEEDIKNSFKKLLPKYGLKREDLFITSKLAPADQGKEKCRKAVLRSLDNLGLDYIDLYLIHWPGSQGHKIDDPGNPQRRAESWKDLEDLHKEGKVKNIGISNYTLQHLEELLSICSVKPAVLQTEYHPHLVQEDLVKVCQKHDIHFQAYSSLGSPKGKQELMTESEVTKIAEAHQKNPAQILLRWAVQQGIGVLPKSTNPSHITENLELFNFELSASEMERLSSLHKEHHYCWDPNAIL